MKTRIVLMGSGVIMAIMLLANPAWAQIALKFIVTHPAVTCAIPATSQVAHLRQNMAAARGRMPDAALRLRMAREVAAL